MSIAKVLVSRYMMLPLALTGVVAGWAYIGPSQYDLETFGHHHICEDVGCLADHLEWVYRERRSETFLGTDDALLWIENPQVAAVIRVNREEHVFGRDFVLDELFYAGNSFVELVFISYGDVKLVEYWPENEQFRRSGCNFGQHAGPMSIHNIFFNVHHAGSFGGGSPEPVICTQSTVTFGQCQACNTLITETINVSFWCSDC